MRWLGWAVVVGCILYALAECIIIRQRKIWIWLCVPFAWIIMGGAAVMLVFDMVVMAIKSFGKKK